MDPEELSLEIEKYQIIAIDLATRMLWKVHQSHPQLFRCLGPEKFGEAWLLESISPRDSEFDRAVLQKFLLLVNNG